jgi:hypothetical protein
MIGPFTVPVAKMGAHPAPGLGIVMTRVPVTTLMFIASVIGPV